MIVGFTGTRKGMTQLQRDALPVILRRLRLTAGRHGDCIGADKQCHAIMRELRAKMFGHPGSDGPLRAHCDFDECAEPRDYLRRNQDIVNLSECMVAAPGQREEQQRSGTWATVRYAKQAGRLLIILWPDGEYEVVF